MSAHLAEIVRELGLKPGQTYREKIDGHAVELRVLEDNLPSAELEARVMLLPWTDFPFTAAGTITNVKRSPLPLPDPPFIPPEDEVPE